MRPYVVSFSHVIEHFSHREVKDVVRELVLRLKKGGTIEIRCPYILPETDVGECEEKSTVDRRMSGISASAASLLGF
jgi:predicted SAM-dependent methyltransferase